LNGGKVTVTNTNRDAVVYATWMPKVTLVIDYTSSSQSGAGNNTDYGDSDNKDTVYVVPGKTYNATAAKNGDKNPDIDIYFNSYTKGDGVQSIDDTKVTVGTDTSVVNKVTATYTKKVEVYSDGSNFVTTDGLLGIGATTSMGTVTVKATGSSNKTCQNKGSLWYKPGVTLTISVSKLNADFKLTVDNDIGTLESNGNLTYVIPESGVTKITIKLVKKNGGSGGGGGCVTGETLITLADGSKVMIRDLKGDEMLLVWNHYTGKVDVAPVIKIIDHNKDFANQLVTTLYFSDGSSVDIVGEHVFFDATLNRYVGITSNNTDCYVGHQFVKINNNHDGIETVKLINYSTETRFIDIYEVNTYEHNVCFTNDLLSAPAYNDIFLNCFEFTGNNFVYSEELIQEDIKKYGLYTYEEFKGLITEELFNAYGFAYFKASVEKGYTTWERIETMCRFAMKHTQ
jgi:hypothetical protein